MGRISEYSIKRLRDFLDTLPMDAKNKCALCNETLTHIVKRAEVESGAGTATVTRELAERINDGAAPGDRVSSDQLRGRVQRQDGTICTNHANNPPPETTEPGRAPSCQEWYHCYQCGKEVPEMSMATSKMCLECANKIRLSDPRSEPKPKVSVFNATNDNIEWAKWTWNPVTGCLHGCPYCYANEIAMRFTGHFKPEFHADRMNAPDNTKIPEGRKNEPGIRNVFVCSMADLFGEWVPQEWIDAVLEKCRNSPQWNFLFLTKNPKRYIGIDWPQNAWVGTTIDTQARVDDAKDAFDKLAASYDGPSVLFVSMEPMLGEIDITGMKHLDWLIVGAQSRTARNLEFQPKWEWVARVTCQAINSGIKVYWKPNLTVRPKEYPDQ